MNKIRTYSLDYYNQRVIDRIMDKYNFSEMEAVRAFLLSETHRMLEDPECAMWEFGERSLFEIWEVEKVTGDPRNSEHIRSEVECPKK